jgi:hypothetical protein
MVQAIRKNAAKQQAPLISVLGGWGGHEPIAVYALDRRKPTPAEIATAIAEWKRAQTKQSNPKPTDTVAS